MKNNPLLQIKLFITRKSGIILMSFFLIFGSFVFINQFVREQEKVKQDMFLHSNMLSSDLIIKLNQMEAYLQLRAYYMEELMNDDLNLVYEPSRIELFSSFGEEHLVDLFQDSNVNILQCELFERHELNSIQSVPKSKQDINYSQAYQKKILQEFEVYEGKDETSALVTENGVYLWKALKKNPRMTYLGIFFNNVEQLLYRDASHTNLKVTLLVKGQYLTVKGEEQLFTESVIQKLYRVSSQLITISEKEHVYFYRHISPDIVFVSSVSKRDIILQSMKNNIGLFLILVLALLIVGVIHDYFLKNKHLMEIKMDVREKELVSSFYKSQLGHIMNTIAEAFVRADSTYTIMEVNQAGADMLGYSMNELLGKVVTEFMTKPIDIKVRKNDGMYSCFEVSLLNKNGDLIYGLVNKSTIIKDNPITKEHYFLISDITELIFAQKNAEDANRSKSRFIANLSHEIRTPMNATIGYIYLLEQTKLDQQQLKYLEKMDYASNTLLEIIDEILDFSKIEADKVSAEKIPFNVHHVIKNGASLFENTAYRKDLVFRIVFEPNVPEFIIGDPYRLRQVLINLVSNAFKFTRSGEVAILVKVIEMSQSRLYKKEVDEEILQICVSDTGIGIPEERMEALFDPFVQADDSTTRIYGGTGLGLAICQKLTFLMGGLVYVKSIEKQGSQFYVELPVKLSSHEAIIYQSSIPSGYMYQSTPKKILIVEDNVLNQELLMELLKQHRHRITIANNGKVAIDILKREHSPRFDLILMDIQMPIQDGYTTTRLIRAMKDYEQVPVIAVTANADKETQIQLAEAGMNDYVLKPISAEDLYVKINIWK